MAEPENIVTTEWAFGPGRRAGGTDRMLGGVGAAVVAALIVGACLVAYSHLDGGAAAHHAQWVRADHIDAADALPVSLPAAAPPIAFLRPVAPGPIILPEPAGLTVRRFFRSPAPARAPPFQPVIAA